jgi:hypothetical protein
MKRRTATCITQHLKMQLLFVRAIYSHSSTIATEDLQKSNVARLLERATLSANLLGTEQA